MNDSQDLDYDLRYQITNHIYHFLSETSDWYDTIENLISNGQSRLILPIDLFDEISSHLSNLLLSSPLVYFPACEEGYQRLFNSIVQANSSLWNGKTQIPTPHLGVKSWLGSQTVTPRGLTARLVNRLVCVEGIVTRCSLVRSKLSKSVHLCDKNGYVITREHSDIHSMQRDSQQTNRGVPKTDKDGNPLNMEVALSAFVDGQTVTLQEMPESSPTGQLPRSVEVSLEDDLIDSVKPGDRVRIFGVYRIVAFKKAQRFTGLCRAFLIANNVEHLRADAISPEITPLDIRMIKDIASRPKAFELLSQSIAPSICGHDLVKKGLLLQLIGGQRKIADNGMKIRGDIHILLVGDPSCGKSQLLRFMLNTSPLSLSTTGRGSSGVGLTAAITTDRDTGERRLEAGAMVLADNGLVCIDEFDKMSSEDRVAIHEVMEQQTVTISKAGINTSLNARTSVLAAANPIYGCFDAEAPLKSQITFPDSLLTRFDLIFIIRDSQSSETDRRICSQVVRQLQHSHSTTSFTVCSSLSRHGLDEEWGILQPKVDHTLKQGEGRYWITSLSAEWPLENALTTQDNKVLTTEFIQKFIYYVKNVHPVPVLGESAKERIALFYAELRQTLAEGQTKSSKNRHARVVPTARTLEACVRLTIAHARLKLKTVADEEDVKEAEDLLLYTLTGHPPEGYARDGTKTPHELMKLTATSSTGSTRQSKRQRHQPSPHEDYSDLSTSSARKKKATVSQINEALASTSLVMVESNDHRNLDDVASQGSVDSMDLWDTPLTPSPVTPKRIKLLMRTLVEIQPNLLTDSVSPKKLLSMVNDILKKNTFTSSEFVSGLRILQSENKIMLVDGEVWFI